MGSSVESAERSESSLDHAGTPELSGAAVRSPSEWQDAVLFETPREMSRSDQACAGCWEASHSLTWSRVCDAAESPTDLCLVCN